MDSKDVTIYDNVYQKFIEWKCKVLKDDDPKNVQEFCERYNITREVIDSFVSKMSFADDILAGSMNWARLKTPEMLHMLYNNIQTKRSSADIKDFITITNELKKKKDERSNLTQINFFNLDDNKFRSIAARYNRDATVIGEGYDSLPSESSEGQAD